jgi:hypothetical protein
MRLPDEVHGEHSKPNVVLRHSTQIVERRFMCFLNLDAHAMLLLLPKFGDLLWTTLFTSNSASDGQRRSQKNGSPQICCLHLAAKSGPMYVFSELGWLSIAALGDCQRRKVEVRTK